MIALVFLQDLLSEDVATTGVSSVFFCLNTSTSFLGTSLPILSAVVHPLSGLPSYEGFL
jgi:hypothetical protein